MEKKYQKLAISIVLDAIGIIPIPFFDFFWAPTSAYIMTKMYKGKKGKIAGIISFLEEIIHAIFTFFALLLYKITSSILYILFLNKPLVFLFKQKT